MQPPQQSDVDPEAVQSWAHGLDDLMQRIGQHYGRREARERAHDYVRALLSPVERKNAWQLAEMASNHTPYGMQNLLGRASWDADRVRDELRAYVSEHLGDPEGILVVDETCIPKKGTKSAGVTRQYCGSLGKRENCQVAVLLAYAGAQGHAFLDRELYLPQGWTEDAQRRQETGIPAELEFRTKPQIASQLLGRALDAGVLATWVTGDEVYGSPYALRADLEERRQRYVLGVAANQYVWAGWGQLRVDELLRDVTEDVWIRLSCGAGAKGPRVYDWAARRINCPVDGWERWGLARRSLAEPVELAYYLVFVPAGTSLEAVVQVAGRRWTIEAAIAEAKGEVGLDQYELRSWTGWYRHITLALVAHAYLAVTRATADAERAKRGVYPPSATHSLAALRRQRGLAGRSACVWRRSAACCGGWCGRCTRRWRWCSAGRGGVDGTKQLHGSATIAAVSLIYNCSTRRNSSAPRLSAAVRRACLRPPCILSVWVYACTGATDRPPQLLEAARKLGSSRPDTQRA
jgi:SRSO17 transposase